MYGDPLSSSRLEVRGLEAELCPQLGSVFGLKTEAGGRQGGKNGKEKEEHVEHKEHIEEINRSEERRTRFHVPAPAKKTTPVTSVRMMIYPLGQKKNKKRENQRENETGARELHVTESQCRERWRLKRSDKKSGGKMVGEGRCLKEAKRGQEMGSGSLMRDQKPGRKDFFILHVF